MAVPNITFCRLREWICNWAWFVSTTTTKVVNEWRHFLRACQCAIDIYWDHTQLPISSKSKQRTRESEKECVWEGEREREETVWKVRYKREGDERKRWVGGGVRMKLGGYFSYPSAEQQQQHYVFTWCISNPITIFIISKDKSLFYDGSNCMLHIF